MSNTYRKDVREFINEAKRQGFRCEGMTGSGHWKLRHDSGASMIVPATPSGYRWRKNMEATMKQIVRGASPALG